MKILSSGSTTLTRIVSENAIRVFRLSLRFIFFCALAGNASFAQNNLQYLAEAVRAGTTEVKRTALLEIRNLRSAEASRLAVPALNDSSEIVRATAPFSIIFLPKDEAAQLLVPLLQDKSELVRREAAYALGKVGNPATVDPLIQVLQKDKINDVRAAAAIALGEIGDISAVNVLGRLLQKNRKDEEEFLRRSAARSIGQIAQRNRIGETKNLDAFRPAVGLLIQTLQTPRESPDVKREAAFALGEIGDASAIPVLEANSSSEDYYLAEISKKALRKIKSVQSSN